MSRSAGRRSCARSSTSSARRISPASCNAMAWTYAYRGSSSLSSAALARSGGLAADPHAVEVLHRNWLAFRRTNDACATRDGAGPDVSLPDDRNAPGQIVAQDGVHLVLDLVEADDLPSRDDLRELVEIGAPHLHAVALGREPVVGELHGLLVREVVKARGVVLDDLHGAVLDRVQLLLVAVVDRPEARGLLVGQRQIRGDKCLLVGANAVEEDVQVRLRRFSGASRGRGESEDQHGGEQNAYARHGQFSLSWAHGVSTTC